MEEVFIGHEIMSISEVIIAASQLKPIKKPSSRLTCWSHSGLFTLHNETRLMHIQTGLIRIDNIHAKLIGRNWFQTNLITIHFPEWIEHTLMQYRQLEVVTLQRIKVSFLTQ